MFLRGKVCRGLLVVLLFNVMIFYATLRQAQDERGRKKKKSQYKKIIDEYKKIKLEDVCLENKNIKKDEFLFGVTTSSYQVEGPGGATDKKYNQWLDAVGQTVEMEVDGKKEHKVIQDPLNACEHWERYKEDIALIKNLGCNTYRFSISWGKLMPKENTYSKEVLDHYEDVCKELQKNNIKPIITLYHYAHPIWFEKKGAFEKEENIKDFVDYGIKVFERLNKYNPIWFTINTFNGVSLHSYYVGTKPPFKKDMGLALKVLKHVLDAHVAFYRKAKAQKDKKTKKSIDSMIGIYKIVFPIEKYRSWQLWDNVGISFASKINGEAIYDFFTKGELKISLGIPALYIKDSIFYENKEAIGALDCVGLNYYSGAYMSNFKVLSRKKNIPTKSKLLTIYPEGFYTALHEVNDCLAKPLNVPIYVTENGVATDNSEHRDVFYRSHLQMLSEAMKEGVDVRSYIVWSLMDNFNWTEGYGLNFGLYAVDKKTQKRTLKEGTQFLVDVIKKHNEKEIKPEIGVVDKKSQDTGVTVPQILCCDTTLSKTIIP
ncbi:glycoside hydrolase family 1 protein [Candidatus Dependentiae bacterium]